jgi:hypothetical protein
MSPLAPAYESTTITPQEALYNNIALLSLPAVFASGFGPLKPGHTIGKNSTTKKCQPQRKTKVTTAVPDTTSVSSIIVAQPQGFRVGDITDIKALADDSVLFNDVVIQAVNYVTGQITFTAALGAGAIVVGDYLVPATADGSETAVGVSLITQEVKTAATGVMSNDYQGAIAVHGFFVPAKVPNYDTKGNSTALVTSTLGGGQILKIG